MKIDINNYIHNDEAERCRTSKKPRNLTPLKGAERCVLCPQFPNLAQRIIIKKRVLAKDKWGDNHSYDFDRVFPELESIIDEILVDIDRLNDYLYTIPVRVIKTSGIDRILFEAKRQKYVIVHEDLLTLNSFAINGHKKTHAECDVYRLLVYYIENEPDEYIELKEYIEDTGRYF